MQRIIQGYKKFQKEYFEKNKDFFHSLIKNGQNPEILVIACSDSRVDPAIVTSALPGDLFVIRNVANLVPPYEDARLGYHGTSAALEFAVCQLKVKNIVVFGHSHCGGMKSLFNDQEIKEDSFLTKWMELAKPAFEDVRSLHQDCEVAKKADLCSKYSLINSLKNLKTFPWISERLQKGDLALHAWYFDIQTCTTTYWDNQYGFIDL